MPKYWDMRTPKYCDFCEPIRYITTFYALYELPSMTSYDLHLWPSLICIDVFYTLYVYVRFYDMLL